MQASSLQHTAADYITHILAPAGGAIHIDVDELAAMGITHVMEVSFCSQHRSLGRKKWHIISTIMPPVRGLIAVEMQVPASRDGASRAVFESDALVAAIGSILADSSKAGVAEAVLAAV